MEAKSPIIPQKDTDRPAIKYLNRHVRDNVAAVWRDVGVQLLNADDKGLLDAIETNYPENVVRCREMFCLWLERTPEATWNQLLQTLRAPSIKLEALASKLEEMLLKEDECIIDFTQYTVEDAFSILLDNLFKNMSQSKLDIIRAVCVSVTEGVFSDSIKQVDSFDSLLELLTKNPTYCNWLNTRILEVIAISCQNENLIRLIQDFKTSVYSRPVKQVFKDIPNLKKDFLSLKTFSQFENLDDMKVNELLPHLLQIKL